MDLGRQHIRGTDNLALCIAKHQDSIRGWMYENARFTLLCVPRGFILESQSQKQFK